MHAERAADPDRVDQVVPFGRVGVDEEVVQHQPGHQRGEDLGGEGDLIHGLPVQADRLVAPVAEAQAKRSGRI